LPRQPQQHATHPQIKKPPSPAACLQHKSSEL
jgi:hypothetical protein